MVAASPIPALPDAERRTSYAPTASTGPFNVGFALYGDSTDFGNWIEVWLNGVMLDPSTYTVTSPTGPLGSIPLPITDAQVTLETAATGDLEIVGAQRPRRTAQLSENVGVSAHDFNQLYTDVIAEMREAWDLRARLIRGVPGDSFSPMPPAASRANLTLGFGPTGDLIVGGPFPGTITVSAALIPFLASATTDLAIEALGVTPAMLAFIKEPSVAAANRYLGQRVYNVLNYGADPTGATDSTAAFNAVYDAIVADGGGLRYVPKGNFVVGTGSVSIKFCDNMGQWLDQGALIRSRFGADGVWTYQNSLFINDNPAGGNKNIWIGGPGKVKSDSSLYNGGCFFSMVNVDGFFFGAGIQLFDIYNLNPIYQAFRTNFRVKNAIIDNVVCGYEDQTSTTGSDYGGQDGVHILGGSSRFIINNVRGTAGDDLVALNIETYASLGGLDADISDFVIDNINGDSKWAQVLRLYVQGTSSGAPNPSFATTTGQIRRGTIGKVNGKANTLGGNGGSNGIIILDESHRIAINYIDFVNTRLDASTVSGAAITIQYASNLWFGKFTPISPKTYQVYIANSTAITFEEINAPTANRTATIPGILAESSCSDIRLKGGNVSNQLGHGIQFSAVTSGIIGNFTLANNTGNGVALPDSIHVRVAFNLFSANTAASAQEYGVANFNAFIGNDSSLNGAGGITILGAQSKAPATANI